MRRTRITQCPRKPRGEKSQSDEYSNGPVISVADAHRSDGKRFVVRADEKLTGFLELNQ